MDVSEGTFQAAVIDRSHTLPVVVDFWAQWCGPCVQLGPVLERAVAARAGKLELAKIDADANPRLVRTFGIRGIPAVKAFRDGKVAAEFTGAKPPAAVDSFLDALLPSDADALVARGDEESLRRALELEPTRSDAAVPLARILHGRGEPAEALEILARVPASFTADGLVARVTLERAASAPGQPTPGQPGAPDLREAFAALDAGAHERALELLLGALSSSDGAREDIRRVIVGILDELGTEHPLAREYRRRLATTIY
ncbi:MAG: co-chaperone YbbN [Solirubrobacterales bacterium]|nr:MAG: co-chaperone YbbN [Solirubrobacterales bacterium]